MIRSSVLCLYTFKNICAHLLHIILKHSSVDIFTTIHLEKLNFETVLQEGYYKPYFDLLLPPNKCKKLWKTFEENTLFFFCSLVSTISFFYESGLSEVYGDAHP